MFIITIEFPVIIELNIIKIVYKTNSPIAQL